MRKGCHCQLRRRKNWVQIVHKNKYQIQQMSFGGIGMEWGPKNKTKHCLHRNHTKRGVCLPIGLLVLVDVTARMRHETTGQCGAVLAGHLINEATQGENTLAAINCSLLITCMCQDIEKSNKYFSEGSKYFWKMQVYSHVDVGDGEVDPEPGVAQPPPGEHVLALVGEGEAAACPARRPEVAGHVARELHAAAGRHGLLGLPHHHLRRARQVLHVCKQKHH